MEADIYGAAVRRVEGQLPRCHNSCGHIQCEQSEGQQAHRAERFYAGRSEGALEERTRRGHKGADCHGLTNDEEGVEEGVEEVAQGR